MNNEQIYINIIFIDIINSLQKSKIPKSFLILEENYFVNKYILLYINNEMYTIYNYKFIFFKNI